MTLKSSDTHEIVMLLCKFVFNNVSQTPEKLYKFLNTKVSAKNLQENYSEIIYVKKLHNPVHIC